MSSGSSNFAPTAVERLKTLAKAISAETARRDIVDLKNLADEVDAQVSCIDQSVCRLSEYDWTRHAKELESLLTETSSVVVKSHGTQYLSWLWHYLGQSGEDEIEQQRQKLSGWSRSFWDSIEASTVTTSLNPKSSPSENAPSHDVPAPPYSPHNPSTSVADAEAAILTTTALSVPDISSRSVEGSPTSSVAGRAQSPAPATASPSPSISGTTQLPPSAGDSQTASPSTAVPQFPSTSHVPDPTHSQSSASRGGSTPDTGRNTNSSTVQPIYQNHGNASGWVIHGGTTTNNFGNYPPNPVPS